MGICLGATIYLMMFDNRSERNDPDLPSREQRDAVAGRVDDWLTHQHGGYREIHDRQLANAFESRLRRIYGLDTWEFGFIELHVDEMHLCGSNAVVALMTVKDDEGYSLIPDRRLDVLADFKLNPSRSGVVLEMLSNPIQVTLVAPDGDPKRATLIPFFSDNAFSELDQHKSTAVTHLKAIRSHDDVSSYPVNQPSLLVNMLLRTVAISVRERLVRSGNNPSSLAWVPVRVDDLESNGNGIYSVKVSLPQLRGPGELVSEFTKEIHQIKLGFNRFFGTVEREWLSSGCAASP